MADLAVLILTKNEEKHIGRAIASVRPFAREIVVVDSHSTDRTATIAREAGATVIENRFVNYARQFQWGLDNAPMTAGWVMRLDADEVIEPDLAAAIEAQLDALPADVTGVNLKRKHVFMDRWIRHGGRYPLVLLRIWRRGAGRIEDRWMDEHIVLSRGRTVTFEGGFADVNLNDLSFFTDKHNKYATREAIDVLLQQYSLLPRDTGLTDRDVFSQAARKRSTKERVYNRLPLGLGPLLFFLYRYVVQLGFLDGRPGLIYHGLQGLWYRFLVDARLEELRRGIAHLTDHDEIRREILRLTGHDVSR